MEVFMKRKEFLFVMMALALVACSQKEKAQAPAEESKEIVEIIWQYPSPGDLGAGFQEMEDALNVMMERDIGVHVRFEPVGLMESQQKAALMVSSGEQLDISLTFLGTLGPLVESGMIVPLDDLIEQYGADIKAQCGDQLAAYSYNGKIYGVPPPGAKGNAYGYIIRDDMLKKYGFTVDENKKYGLADLEVIFEKVKAGEGPNFYCTIPWNTEMAPLNNSYIEYDGSLACGVLMLNRSFTDLTITNLFATPEYKNYAEMMYHWAQKGYISPDAAVTAEFSETLMKSGNYLGEMYWHNPKNKYEAMAGLGMSISSMKLLDGYVLNTSNAGVSWNIPVTSANPAKAVQALN
jgi:putative aldouronate transport system substrate-binding protein